MTQRAGQDENNQRSGVQQEASSWDHSSHKEFFDYYSKESLSPQALRRIRSIRAAILRSLETKGGPAQIYQVADIGCGAGTQSLLWAELGYQVHGLDVNEPLVRLARERASEAGYTIEFRVGSAAELPWADESMDICIALELLEHVAEWQACLREFTRILRPGGVLFLTTTNKLCPRQLEFNLPLYSWYPAPLKRRFERLAVTTRPALANFAKYPAVNWFSFYSLRASLAKLGFRSLDRFDIMDTRNKPESAKLIVRSVRAVPSLRWLAHVCTSGTTVLAIKLPRR